MACCTSITRRFPYNFIALGLFTLAESYLVGTIASFYKTDAVLIAIGGTVLITVGLTLFAWQTKIDFTAMSSSIFVIALSFMFFGILVAIMRSEILRLVYATIGVIVFGLFLVYDTQVSARATRIFTYPCPARRTLDAELRLQAQLVSFNVASGCCVWLRERLGRAVILILILVPGSTCFYPPFPLFRPPSRALQLIMGGKHREYAYGPDEYIIAALNVYLDIINIFLYLLRIVGAARSD